MASPPLAVVPEDPGEGSGAGGRGGTTPPPPPPAIPAERPQITDQDERDDYKQVLSVLLSAVQRERSRADQFYVRARNLLAYATALFSAVQVAFIANVGRESANTPLIDGDERAMVAYAAAAGLAALVMGALVLFAGADRAQKQDMVTGSDLASLLNPSGPYVATPVLMTLVRKVAKEEEAWATANRKRAKLNLVLAIDIAIAALAALTELVILYTAVA